MLSRVYVTVCLLTSFQGFALLNTGIYTPNFLRAQSSTDGTGQYWAPNIFISIDYRMPLFGAIAFDPEVGYIQHFDNEDESSHRTIFLLYNFEYEISKEFQIRFGGGTFISTISGDGTAVVLNNGTGTQTFYAPSESATSYTGSLTAGLRVGVATNYSVRFDANLMRFLDGDRRSVSYLLSLNYNM